jgi:predicted PurR-regulated permease PerM
MPEPGRKHFTTSTLMWACLQLLIAIIALSLAIEYLKQIWIYLLLAAVLVSGISLIVWWIRRRNRW